MVPVSEVPPPLVLDRLDLVLGTQPVLEGASLTVHQGEVVAIVGAVGVGKSSVVRLACGALRPGSGSVRTLGVNPAQDIQPTVGRMGVLFQSNGLLATMTIRENLALPLSYHERDIPEELEETLLEAMLAAGLDSSELENRPSVLSGGELRRAALARAWLTGHELLLLDDLLRGREFDDTASFRAFSDRVRTRGPSSIVLTTQDVTLAAEIADRIVAVVDLDLVELDPSLPIPELSARALGILS